MEPKKQGIDGTTKLPDEIVIVYVCPICKNYYGSSSMGDLAASEVIAPPEARDAGQIRGHRSDCPVCKIPRKKRYARLVPAEEQALIEGHVHKRVKAETKAAMA